MFTDVCIHCITFSYQTLTSCTSISATLLLSHIKLDDFGLFDSKMMPLEGDLQSVRWCKLWSWNGIIHLKQSWWWDSTGSETIEQNMARRLLAKTQERHCVREERL